MPTSELPSGVLHVRATDQPKQNKDYRQVHFPKRKSDDTESQAMAHYAVVERPAASPGTSAEFLLLREAASRLEAQTRQTTRAVNQLHNLLSRVFPELALMTKNIASRPTRPCPPRRTSQWKPSWASARKPPPRWWPRSSRSTVSIRRANSSVTSASSPKNRVPASTNRAGRSLRAPCRCPAKETTWSEPICGWPPKARSCITRRSAPYTHRLPLYEAAVSLAQAFGLPLNREEEPVKKRPTP